MIGVVGHRSWIAEHLMAALPDSAPVSKQSIIDNTAVLDDIDCLYVFPGRARPDPHDAAEEIKLVISLTNLSSHPKRIVFLSSMAPYGTPYGDLKRSHEVVLANARDRMPRTFIIRAGAVFGPGQPIDSPMLIPSLGREGAALDLRSPQLLTRLISVRSLVDHLKKFADVNYWDSNWCGDPQSIFDVPGTFTIMPEQLKDLWETWDHYSSLRRER